jgi:hypothetical protein
MGETFAKVLETEILEVRKKSMAKIYFNKPEGNIVKQLIIKVSVFFKIKRDGFVFL